MIANVPASGTTDEVWCADCPAPATGSRGERPYCAEHDPRRVQVLMPVAQAARLVAWIGHATDHYPNADSEDLRAAIEAALATNAPTS